MSNQSERMNRTILILSVVVILITILIVRHCVQQDQAYYTIEQVCPALLDIKEIRSDILDELKSVQNETEQWVDWPERDLYSNSTWTVLPLCVFGNWSNRTTGLFPVLTSFLKERVPNLRMALISRMSAGTRLTPHRGWGGYSNGVLRCHYGLQVPSRGGCYVTVGKQHKHHVNGEWFVFDDSKTHSACNLNVDHEDRIVLIVDVDRPWWIKDGTSPAQDTTELTELVNAFNLSNSTQSSDALH